MSQSAPGSADAKGSERTEFIDSHVHLWRLGAGWYPTIAKGGESEFGLGNTDGMVRDYVLADYLSDVSDLYVPKFVHVAAVEVPDKFVEETRWLDSLAAESGYPNAIVGTVDYSQDLTALAAELDAHGESELFRGIRVLVPVDYTSAQGEGLLALLAERGLSLDVVAFPGGIGAAAAAAAKHEGVPFLLEHTGWPLVADDPEQFDLWKREMTEFAAVDSTRCKLSGLAMHLHDQDVERQRPYLEHCLEVFGAERCMVGSNLPVDALYGDFDELFEIYTSVFGGLSETEQNAIFARTAEAAYRI